MVNSERLRENECKNWIDTFKYKYAKCVREKLYLM